MRSVLVDHGHAAEYGGPLAHGGEYVAVVEAVIAHLNEHHAAHPARLRVGQQLLGREAGRLHVGHCEAGGEWKPLDVARPDVRMGIDGAGGRILGGRRGFE